MATFLRCARLAATAGVRTFNWTQTAPTVCLQTQRAFSLSTPNLGDKKFTEGHEWIEIDGDTGKIGLSDHAQDALGDIVFVELPEEGLTFEMNDECGVVESVKAVSEIFCPVSGTIVSRNEDVVSEPGLINKSCMDKGWLFKIKLSKLSELDGLMDENGYKKFLKDSE